MQCPCHSGQPYATCCAPYHTGTLLPDPVHLMRARYSAFALGDVAYILKTTHPHHKDQKIGREKRKKGIASFSQKTQFLGLDIQKIEEKPPFVEVTFHATLTQEGHDASFTETSRFALWQGKWMYLSGTLSSS